MFIQCNFYVEIYFSFGLVSFNVSFCSCYSYNALSVISWKHSGYLACF